MNVRHFSLKNVEMTPRQHDREEAIRVVWEKIWKISPQFQAKHPGYIAPEAIFKDMPLTLKFDFFQLADLRFAKGCLYFLTTGQEGEPMNLHEMRSGLIPGPDPKLVQDETKPPESETKTAESEPIRMDEALAPQPREIASAGIPIASERPKPPDLSQDAIIAALWEAHTSIGQWLQLARSQRGRYTNPGHEPYCPTASAIDKDISLRERIALLAVTLTEQEEIASQKTIGLVYNLGNAMVKIGSLRNFVELAEKKSADKFNACLYCSRFLPSGHADNCALIQALDTLKPIAESSISPSPNEQMLNGHGLPPGWRWMKTGNIAKPGDYLCPEGSDPLRVENNFEIKSGHAPVMRRMATWSTKTPGKW